MSTTIRRKVRLALFGGRNTAKLYSALQIAYGITGSYQRIIVLDSTGKADRYSLLGDYHVCGIHPDATPDRYCTLLNIVQASPHDLIILDLSEEWRTVTAQMNEYGYQQTLSSHRTLMQQIKHSCAHVIALVDTESKLQVRDGEGNCKLHYEERPVQQDGVGSFFTAILRLDRKGKATALKDLTSTLPRCTAFAPNALTGATLQDWCLQGKPVVPADLQKKINACQSLEELYQLLFSEEVSDVEMVSAFTQRRLKLEELRQREFEGSEYPF